MRLPPLALPLLVLAACSGEDDAAREVERGAPTPAPAPAVPLVLNDVALDQPLRLTGTEPFWGVDITRDAMVYGGVDRPTQRAANPGPVVQGTTAVWASATESGQPLVVTLAATPCSDGMSNRTYPLTARVELGAETLNGCAAPVEFYETVGEDGRPKTAEG